MFTLAKELKMSVAQLNMSMDARELMEWVAYYKLLDDKRANEVAILVEQDRTDTERGNRIKAFLNTMRPKNGTKK